MLAVNLNTKLITDTDFHPATVPTTTQAYRLGMLSAQLGEICVPESIFVFRHDRKEYCRGYVSVAGHTITTVQILGAQ